MTMIDERIAETDPQLRIGGVTANGILQDVDRILALTIAGEGFGNPQPAFRGRELAEERVARLGQREDVSLFIRLCRRAWQAWASLESVSRSSDEQGGGACR